MVRTLSRPEPFTWYSTPERSFLPGADGGFIAPNGEELLSAQQILDRLYPPSFLEAPRRDSLVVRAFVNYANSLYNPAAASRGPWAPSMAPFTSALETIGPLIAHPFWQQLEVLASPLHLRHRRLPVATSADVLVRFRNGGDIGIGICFSCRPDQINPERVAAELGAGLALLGDSHSWWPRRAFVLFCSPGKTTVELLEADTAVPAWIDALDIYRFMAPIFKWKHL